MIPINFLDKAERAFNVLGANVQVGTNSYSRFSNTKGRLVKKSDIAKIHKWVVLHFLHYRITQSILRCIQLIKRPCLKS